MAVYYIPLYIFILTVFDILNILYFWIVLDIRFKAIFNKKGH